MNETTVTIVGNVLNEPDCRRLGESQKLVTNFKVAATARRYDRHEERWVDGDTLRLRVTCWRQLAENVIRSVHVGDPVIVTGRLTSRNWETEDHVKRVAYELEATTVGHDLTRGRAKFARVKTSTMTSSIDDELSDARIAGQLTTPVTELNDLPRQRDYDAELGGFVTTVEEPAIAEQDPFAEAQAAAQRDAFAEAKAAVTERDPFAEDILTEFDHAVNAAFDGAAFAAMGGTTAPDNAAELTTGDGATGGEGEGGVSDEETSPDETDEPSGGRRRRSRGRVAVPA
ncbi:single-stranded DNA-binding protein [Dactylosporangium sp. NPDC005555]|uniref:single-stranded DNA-binding protein n=1 Tax=Dactylosporangium sp. NPDC005555 TaxID=3154889 RepID=UPI0033A78810